MTGVAGLAYQKMSVDIAGGAPTCQPILFRPSVKLRRLYIAWGVAFALQFDGRTIPLATTKGLSQIVTPDLQQEGEFSLSPQIQNKKSVIRINCKPEWE